MKPWVCIGKIIAAHGIKGQVKIRVFTDPELINESGPLVDAKEKSVVLKNISVKSHTVIHASIAGVTTRNDAEILKGTELFIHEDNLPPLSEEEVLIDQFINLPLIADGKILGTVIGVYDFGAGLFCEVKTPTGKVGTVHINSCTVFDDKIECEEDHFLI